MRRARVLDGERTVSRLVFARVRRALRNRVRGTSDSLELEWSELEASDEIELEVLVGEAFLAIARRSLMVR